jgi:hypothetical protein
MSSSKTTNSSQNTNSTSSLIQTPTNPSYVDQGLSGLVGQISNLSNVDPYSLIAGPSALQNTAATNAQGLTGTPWDYSAANDVAGGVANAKTPDISSLIGNFENPYTNDVVNTSLAGFDQNAAQTKAQNLLNQAQDTTFGGSGASITNALTNGQLALARGQLESGLRSQGFDTALQGATSQAQLQQQQQAEKLAAANAISNNATAFNNTQNQNISTQSGLGAILQQLQQAQTGAPISLLGTQAGLFSGLPLGLEHGTDANGAQQGTSTGTSTTTSSDPLGTLGSLVGTAGSLFASPFTGGTSLGSLLGAFTGGGSSSLAGGLGNLFHNDPSGMWSLGSAGA